MMLLMHHMAYAFTIIDPTRTFLSFGIIDLYPLLMNGWIGFDLFIVICAFLATRTWLLKPERTYKQYVGQRFMRILPTYYAMLILFSVGAFPYFVPLEPINWFSLAYHIALLPDVFFSNIMVLFSTIAVELKYILLAPILVGFSLTRARPTLTLCILATFFIGFGLFMRDFGFSQYIPHRDPEVYRENIFRCAMLTRISFVCWFETLFIGIGIAYLEHRCRENPKLEIPVKIARIAFSGGLIILLIWLAIKDHWEVVSYFDAMYQPILTAGISGLLVFGSAFGGAPKIFAGKIPRYFSPLTIPIFLVHLPLMFPAVLMIYTYFPKLMNATHYAPAFLCVTIIYLALTWILAEIIYRTVQIKIVGAVQRYFKKA